MENCTLYSHQLDFDTVINLAKKHLPKADFETSDNGTQKSLKATIKGGFFSKTKTLTINYRQRITPSYQLQEATCGLTQNLMGMSNFIQSIPAQNSSVQQQLLYKVASLNCEMLFMAEPAIIPKFAELLKDILQALDGIVFAQPNSLFQQSNGQHFTDKNLQLILDTNGKSQIDHLEVKADAKYHDPDPEDNTSAQNSRKRRSEAFLQTKGISINTHLPAVRSEDQVELRTPEEIINRAYALLVIAVKGEGIEQKHLDNAIATKNIQHFSPKEREILAKAQLNPQEKAYATWRYEGLYVLLWALGKLENLHYPSEICNVQEVVAAIFNPERAAFEKTIQVKSKETILNELDKTYRFHWACVNARIKGQEVGGEINPSVTYERHYALNWLTKNQNQPWDQVETST